MKKILFSLPILAISFVACSQDIAPEKVPSVVQNALKVRYSDATAIEWNKAGQNFEAEFKQGTNEYEALISETGQLLSVKQDIALADLPAAISTAISGQFAGYKIDDTERVENGGQVYYQVELEKRFSGKKLVFSPEGQVAANIAFWD